MPVAIRRPKEGPVEKHLLSTCRKRGLLCLKFSSPSSGGVPDRVILTPAGTVFVELKRPGGVPDKRQLAVHKKMRRFGAEGFIVDSFATVDRLVALLATRASSPVPTSHSGVPR